MRNVASAQAAGGKPSPVLGVGVQGNLLVVKDGATLPDRCICCDTPTTNRVVKRFSWNEDDGGPGAARLIPFVGRLMWLIWLIQRMSNREYVTIQYCICPAHKGRKLLLTIVTAICMTVGMGLFTLSFWSRGNAMWIAAGVVFVAGIITAMLRPARLGVVGRSSMGYGISGAGAKFLASLKQQNTVRVKASR